MLRSAGTAFRRYWSGERRRRMAADKTILRTLNKLSEEGFDTEKKITSIDMKSAFEYGLSDEIGGILKLQEAIKAHRQLAYLLNGTDMKKEGRTHAGKGTGIGSESEEPGGAEGSGGPDPGRDDTEPGSGGD